MTSPNPREEGRAVERFTHSPRAGCVAGLHDIVVAANFNIVAERVMPTDAAMIVAALNDFASMRARAERAEAEVVRVIRVKDAVMRRAEQAERERDEYLAALADWPKALDEWAGKYRAAERELAEARKALRTCADLAARETVRSFAPRNTLVRIADVALTAVEPTPQAKLDAFNLLRGTPTPSTDPA